VLIHLTNKPSILLTTQEAAQDQKYTLSLKTQ